MSNPTATQRLIGNITFSAIKLLMQVSKGNESKKLFQPGSIILHFRANFSPASNIKPSLFC